LERKPVPNEKPLMKLLDWLGTIFLLVVFWPLRLVAARRYWVPRFMALSDKVGLHVLTTHYYEPTYREQDLPAQTAVERSLPGIDLNESGQLALLEQCRFQHELLAIPAIKPGDMDYGYSAAMFGPGDAEMAYNLIRLKRPARIIEIGSGDSTLIAMLAIKANRAEDPAYQCRQICIEPYEKPWLERADVELYRARAELIDLAVFDTLEADDILFIDSSHVIRPWGDVLREFHEIIPRLKPGVIVHVHDIYTPRDYPERYLRNERRLWNEQYLLEAYLSFNHRTEVICATNWLSKNHFDAFARACPVFAKDPARETVSFWFRTRA
jgi:predicted O-methyltransferase YrrM